MSLELFQKFSEYEDALIKKYENDPLFLHIENLSNEEFINVLVQYGEGISANFVKFLETALRQVRDEFAQQAILHILRDEIPQNGPTHQQMRTQAMQRIGIDSEELVSSDLTAPTKKTIDMYFDVITNQAKQWRNRDLGITTFVRVVGESLVGVVYKVFTVEIMRRFGVTEDEVSFYSFHWHHDEKGGDPVDGEHGHTEYYDQAMEHLLQSQSDLELARNVADIALSIRQGFQKQFLK